jgi:hypothetical protein
MRHLLHNLAFHEVFSGFSVLFSLQLQLSAKNTPNPNPFISFQPFCLLRMHNNGGSSRKLSDLRPKDTFWECSGWHHRHVYLLIKTKTSNATSFSTSFPIINHHECLCKESFCRRRNRWSRIPSYGLACQELLPSLGHLPQVR